MKIRAENSNLNDSRGQPITGTPQINGRFGIDISLPFRLQHAIDQVYNDYSDRVLIKPKCLSRFGQNENVGTDFATLMTLPSGVLEETYISSNGITHISSSDAGDTEAVTVEGHTISGSDLTYVTQDVTLTGQTKAELTTPLARVDNVYNIGSTDWAGQVYVFEDDTLTGGVPNTNSKVHLISHPAGLVRNQSFKGATSVSSQDYWFITAIRVGVDKKTTASVDVELQVRQLNGVFRTLFEIPVSTSGSNSISLRLDPVIVAPKNSDIKLRARASTTAVSVSGRMEGYLAQVQS